MLIHILFRNVVGVSYTPRNIATGFRFQAGKLLMIQDVRYFAFLSSITPLLHCIYFKSMVLSHTTQLIQISNTRYGVIRWCSFLSGCSGITFGHFVGCHNQVILGPLTSVMLLAGSEAAQHTHTKPWKSHNR